MKEVNIVFRTLWSERSVSADEPYKQWVKQGFDWCNDLLSSESEKNRIINRIVGQFAELCERYDEVHEMVNKRDSKISWLEHDIDQKEQTIKYLESFIKFCGTCKNPEGDCIC